MRIGTSLSYSGGFVEAVEELRDLERAGLGIVHVAEAYTYDAISQLGYIAAKTDRLEIASGIVPIYTRTPTLLAMTAAGLDYVSGGRFTLGVGASGPQVIEGFHGVPYDAPVGRTREAVEICRKVWRREVVVNQGRYYPIPLPEGQGSGLGKPLRLINHPVRERIPISIAAMGAKNVALTAEIAEGWLPAFFHPGKAGAAFAKPLADGLAKRDPQLGPLEIHASAPACVGAGADAALGPFREQIALYVGGMGARGRNFYNDLMCRYDYEEEAERIQDLYLGGKKQEAAAAVPEELVRALALVGSEAEVTERMGEYARAGVTTLSVNLLGPGAADRAGRVRMVEQLARIAEGLRS
jgi:F420-dependent oxidoreductase-like protein